MLDERGGTIKVLGTHLAMTYDHLFCFYSLNVTRISKGRQKKERYEEREKERGKREKESFDPKPLCHVSQGFTFVHPDNDPSFFHLKRTHTPSLTHARTNTHTLSLSLSLSQNTHTQTRTQTQILKDLVLQRKNTKEDLVLGSKKN